MKRTVMTINHNGSYKVIFDDKEKTNPYSIYKVWYDMGKHQKLIVKYGDFGSCLCHLKDLYIR